MQTRQWRRVLIGLMAVGLVAAGCSSSTDAGPDPVKVGLIASLSGPYQVTGEDIRDGFALYLELNDGMLGGREAEIILVDEGAGAAEARAAADRLVRQEDVAALAGIVNSDSFLAIHELAVEREIPMVGALARPQILWDEGIDYVWSTSFLNKHSGQAVVDHLLEEIDGPIWAIGPDNQGGIDVMTAFAEGLVERGGELANPTGAPTLVPFPETSNFLPYLTEIADSGAQGIFAFFAGVQAIDFVTQRAQSPAADLPLYGVGMTDGAVLEAQGPAAEGIRSSFYYSADLDNPANHRFVAEWSKRHDRSPTPMVVSSYDAAMVLDLAIGTIDGEVTPMAINDAMATLGAIDSPRGQWRFSPVTHAPVQRWYLREVAERDGRLTNVLVKELDIQRD